MFKYLLWCSCFILTMFNLGLAADQIQLAAEYRVDTMWATAYQVTVKLTNKTDQPTESWTANFTLPTQNALSSHVSGGKFAPKGSQVTVTNLDSNGSIAAMGSVTFNMIINMPQSGNATIDNLQAGGYTSAPPSNSGLFAPVLNPISSSSAVDYTVSWNEVANATTYYLEVDQRSDFINATVIKEDGDFVNVINQLPGTYYYRVAAGNSAGRSFYSNVQSITVVVNQNSVPLVATYAVDTNWATAFQTTVKLTNTTGVPVKGWTATFALPNGYSLSSHMSSGVFTTQGQTVTVKNLVTNDTIQPNGSVTFNMIIVKPSGAKSEIQNLVASGKSTSTNPLPLPSAPVLALQTITDNSYTVSWGSSNYADSYTLQESSDENFAQLTFIAQGNILTQSFTNKPSGKYYYRAFSSNVSGNSAYSNIVSVTVGDDNPIPPSNALEYSVWYIDWTSWFTGSTFVIPNDSNMINIFVGQMMYGENGQPTMGGFGTFTKAQMRAFVQYLAAQPSPIQAKVSIGGAGGMYDRTWDILTSANISAFAQGMVDFCHEIGLAGVDFDYEAFASREQEALVGELIKAFKLLDPNLQTSLCSNAGFGPNFPWQESVKTILDAAMISPGNCALDRFYIMSYYNSMQEEIGWIVGSDGNGGWANWLITNYGFTRARISVGIDDFDAHAYDPSVFKAWAISEGLSIAHWAFDPAHPQ